MRKLDDQIQTSYNKMLEKQDEENEKPTEGAGKRSVFSPPRDKKQQTPLKTTYRTPLKGDIEQHKYSIFYLNL